MPSIRSFRFTRHPLASTTTNVRCPGAAFGVARIPIPIPESYQGRRIRFEIAADVKYPRRRGKLLRFRTGRRAGPVRQLDQGYRLLTALGTLCFGILYEARPATALMQLPAGTI